MPDQERRPGRFGAYASVIQLLALVILSGTGDGGTTLNAGTLASVLFWICAATLLARRHGRVSGIDLLFLRWGLLPFVLIGTPLLLPLVEWGPWLGLVVLPSGAALLVMALLYLIVRIFGLRSPFDELGK